MGSRRNEKEFKLIQNGKTGGEIVGGRMEIRSMLQEGGREGIKGWREAEGRKVEVEGWRESGKKWEEVYIKPMDSHSPLCSHPWCIGQQWLLTGIVSRNCNVGRSRTD